MTQWCQAVRPFSRLRHFMQPIQGNIALLVDHQSKPSVPWSCEGSLWTAGDSADLALCCVCAGGAWIRSLFGPVSGCAICSSIVARVSFYCDFWWIDLASKSLVRGCSGMHFTTMGGDTPEEYQKFGIEFSCCSSNRPSNVFFVQFWYVSMQGSSGCLQNGRLSQRRHCGSFCSSAFRVSQDCGMGSNMRLGFATECDCYMTCDGYGSSTVRPRKAQCSTQIGILQMNEGDHQISFKRTFFFSRQVL